MNSLERKEKRYFRRKEKRERKLIDINNKYSNVASCFTFLKVFGEAKKCTRNVGYKKSTLNFKLNMFSIVGKTCIDIKSSSYKVNKTFKFQINERGKIRDIDAPHFNDRLVHKVISYHILIPLYDRYLIYDNGASSINKGFSFAIKRVKHFLSYWYHLYGNNGYVVLIDFSKFFPNCSHDIVKLIHNKYIFDDYTKKVIEDYLFINEGLALGVEIAQRKSLMFPNVLDHFISQNGNPIVRYMDDTIFFTKDFDEAKMLLNRYIEIANSLRIKINPNKTKIVRIGNYFEFCKWKYNVLDSGKIIIIPSKKTIYRQRRKLKRMLKKNINRDEIKISLISFIGYLSQGNSYKYINILDNLYKERVIYHNSNNLSGIR